MNPERRRGARSPGRALYAASFRRPAAIFAASVAAFGASHADPLAPPLRQLPIIVTYEMKRQHDAAVGERRDPKGFWISQIVARLEDKKPATPLRLKQPATAQVDFIVGRDGRVTSRMIGKSSGDPVADKEALAMIERSQPFPPMPAAMSEKDLAFSLPLRFR